MQFHHYVYRYDLAQSLIRVGIVSIIAVASLTMSLSAKAKGNAYVSLGYGYTTGSYGLNTKSVSSAIPFKVLYNTKHWDISYGQMYLTLESPEGVIVTQDGAGEVVRLASGNAFKRSGFSDSVAEINYRFRLDRIDIDKFFVGAKVKVPSSEESNDFGSGESDWYFHGGFSQRIKSWSLKWKGSIQQVGAKSISLKSKRYASKISAKYYVSAKQSLGTTLRYKTASSIYTENKLTASFEYSKSLSRHQALSAYIGTGFTESSPDRFAGIRIVQKVK